MNPSSAATTSSSSSSQQHAQGQDDGNIFKKQPIPRWVPVTLLALTTASLTVPAVVLWRQRPRPNVRPSTANVSTAPIRRSVASRWKSSPPVSRAEGSGDTVASTSTSTSYPPTRRISASFSGPIKVDSTHSKPPSPSLKENPQSPTAVTGAAPSQGLFDGPLAGLGAFGIATFAVGLGATLGVWGVQRSMGVQNTEEFAARMRELLLKHVPILSRKLYGNQDAVIDDKSIDGALTSNSTNWTWSEAEDRLREAFDKGGFSVWAEAAMKEMEAEGQAERKKRGL